MITKVRTSPNYCDPPIEGSHDKDIAVFTTQEPTDMFYFDTHLSADDGCKCQINTNPLRMLLNQKRIDELMLIGEDNALKWYNSLKANSQVTSEFSELTKNLSADEIREMIRPKCLQSLSELNSWCKYMSNNMDQFNDQLSAARDRLVEAEAEKAKASQSVTSGAAT